MADQKINAAGYDRTVIGSIDSCTNAAKGEYKISYQQTKFSAYSADVDKVYTKGTSVYVLIPGNDFSKTKTILGTVGNIGEYSGKYIPQELHYEETSPDYIEDNEANPIKLCSYLGGSGHEYRVLLYKDSAYTDYASDPNVKDLSSGDNAPFAEVLASEFVDSITDSGYIILRANINTTIPQENQEVGEYGFEFIVEVEGEDGYKIIQCSSNSLSGNPLKYSVPQIQSWYKKNPQIKKLVAIQAYVKGFSIYKSIDDKPEYDIIIKDIELYSGKFVEDSAITTRTLFLQRPDGIKFTTGVSELRVRAVLKQQGEEISFNEEDVTYYWFIEQPDQIYKDGLSQDEKTWLAIGGEGWRYVGQSSQNEKIFNREDFPAEETVIKCVLRYHPKADGTTTAVQDVRYAATTRLLNDQGYSLEDFKIYECAINAEVLYDEVLTQEEINDFQWTEDNGDGYTFYSTGAQVALYGKNINNDSFITQWFVLNISGDYVERKSEAFNIDGERQVIETNGADALIYGNTKLMCCFYEVNGNQKKYICHKDYNIQYAESSANYDYLVYFLNGDRTFIYNDAGIAPTEAADGQTVVIDPVTLKLKDVKSGAIISAEDIAGSASAEDNQNRSNITWLVVADAKDRLIDFDAYEQETDDTGTHNKVLTIDGIEYYCAYGPSVSYHLLTNYTTNANSNWIRAMIKYEKKTIIAQTSFYCYKAGDPNTTLSNAYCDIIPNYDSGKDNNVYTYFNIYYSDGDYSGLNICPLNDKGKRVWDNGTPGTTESFRFRYFEGGKWTTLPSVEWTWLGRADGNGVSGWQTGNGYTAAGRGLLRASGVVQSQAAGDAEVTIDSNYIATIPVGYCTNTHIRLVENSGFTYIKYGSNGRRPVYDSNRPFELFVLDEDGNNITDKCTFKWSVITQLYNLPSKKSMQTNLLIINKDESEDNINNRKCYIGVDSSVNINEFDPVGIEVRCSVTGPGSAAIGTMYLPIHVYKMTDSDVCGLRGWDGHTLTLSQDPEAYILGNMVAAGTMSSGQFTGVLIGKITSMATDEAIDNDGTETGLMAFNSGKRTAFINARNGETILGREDVGTIQIKPGSQPTIVSGGYRRSYFDEETEEDVEGTGLKINFGDDPSITYGSGNFSVDARGKLTTKEMVALEADIDGKFKAGNKTECDSLIYENVPEDGDPTKASYVQVVDNGFSLRHAEYKGIKSAEAYLQSISEDYDGEEDEMTFDKVNLEGPMFTKAEISDTEISYGDYINNQLIRGLQYRGGKINLTGSLTATGATIQGNFSAGNKSKVRELRAAVKAQDLSTLTDDKMSASYVTVGNGGQFTLCSYEAKPSVEGKYIKETTDNIEVEDGKGGKTTKLEKMMEIATVAPGSVGYSEAIVNSNGFSFGTYARNQVLDDIGTLGDVQISGIKYRAGNLSITGKITATSGMIGGWTINESYIASPGGGLKLYSDGRISGFGYKETTQIGSSSGDSVTTEDNDWLDMSSRTIAWKKKSSERAWTDQTTESGYKYKAFVETQANTTVAAIQSKSGILSMAGNLGVNISAPTSGSISLNAGSSGGLNVDGTGNSDSKTAAATLSSSSGCSVVKLASTNKDKYTEGGTSFYCETGFITTLSTYASAVKNDKKEILKYHREKEVYQTDKNGKPVKDEHGQQIELTPIKEDGYIVTAIDPDTNKKIYKKNPTPKEIYDYYNDSNLFIPATKIKDTLSNEKKGWIRQGYTFEVVNYYPAIPSRIIGYAPDKVTLNIKDEDKNKRGTVTVRIHDNPPVTLFEDGTYNKYSLTEKYYKELSKIIYDDPDYDESIELTWWLYTDEDNQVKLLQSPDGHYTLFEGFELLQGG